MHSIDVELCEPVPAEVPVGADLVLKLRVSCPAGCDLSGLAAKVTGPGEQAVTIAPGEAADDAPLEIALKTPQQVGEHAWSIAFPPHESAGVLHEGCTLPVRLRTKPHATSLAVWAVPSPVVMGERFRIKVGAKSSAACALEGRDILVTNQAGTVVAHGSLGATPWPGTSALYWTEVELPAPAQEGMSWWSVSFAAADIETPHEGASSRFSVAVVRPPEHRLTVEVFEKDTMAPVEDAQVRLGAYRAATDPSGHAEVAMPKGTYDLTVWKVGYEAPGQIVDIREDATIQVEVVIVPPENPDAAWIM
ncbi:MAG TPA: carboxypeptidase-like regulatory domain-containing protein [Xanthobacteraceae bacterium]